MWEYLQEINVVSVTLRLLLALICGGIVGIERGQKKRPAGFRTYMLVCMGSALVMITGQYLIDIYPNTDLTRMGAQVISGIGFLGAGTIIVTGKRQVKGLTTAAGLWAVACLGLAIGIGFYQGAIISCVLIFVVLTFFHQIETRLGQKSKDINFYVELKKATDVGELLTLAKENGMRVLNVEITKEQTEYGKTIALFNLVGNGKMTHNEIIHLFSMPDSVLHIEEY